ncbi:NAD-dependent protein deacylase Sirt4 [Parasteatoda tepidariorum]|uniref:NAD-dependent protein deacylase Sirt4 n=1 Tax=Parasteatoda tepidariorum TaxID=114398 RepID=UPI00077FB4FE|nr:NAD-dependent protein deacylase Sirt4 [Parasteatoda tepidariorum]
MDTIRKQIFLKYLHLSTRHLNLKYVPKHDSCNSESISLLQNFINNHKSLFVLTGAGVSTESGLPDYRSKDVGLYDRSSHRPVQYKDFISNCEVRKRYWARNFAGWKTFSSVQPNSVHLSLAEWEKNNLIHCLVTQNVDRLHHKAGSKNVIELHGTSYLVKCLNCPNLFSRHSFQSLLLSLNPSFQVEEVEIRPDADVELNSELINSFNVPDCEKCGGILKPDVVFFGENVRKEKVFNVRQQLELSNAVIVLGSSLQVYSGYRFLSAASELKKKICIVNIGPTRADEIADLKLSVRCGDIVPKIELL